MSDTQEYPKKRITWVKSTIGTKKEHRLTMQALGFKRRGQTIEKTVTKSIQGMIDQVSYLIRVEED